MPALPQIKLGKRADELVRFLDKELCRTEDFRQKFLSELRLDDENYDAKPYPKNFPWPGCSNIRVPIIRIVCDALTARFVNTIEGHQPRIWSVNPRPGRASFIQHAKAAQDFMENVAMNPDEMDMHKVLMDAIPAFTRRGTAIIKVPYITQIQPGVIYDRALNPVETQEVLVDAVRPQYIPDEDFLVPPEALEIESAPWVSHKFRLTREQILLREKMGHWQKGTFEKVKRHPIGTPTTDAQKRAKARQGVTDTERGKGDTIDYWEFHEVWMRYDVKGDGTALPVVAVFHKPTRTLGRVVYNWYWHGRRPFVRLRFMPQENTFYAPGIARRLRTLATAMDTVLNQQIDNHTLANTRLWKVKSGEPGLRGGFRVWAGRSVVLNDMASLDAIQMGEPYTGSTNFTLNTLQQMIERDSAIFDFNLGAESSLKSAVPATSTLAVLQEGNKRIDLTIRDIRAHLGMMGHMAMASYQQFNPVGKVFSLLDEEKGMLVDQLFRLPPLAIKEGLGVELAASSAQLNRDVQRQNHMALTQISSQYYQSVLQLGQMFIQVQQMAPQFAGAIAKIIDKSADIFERTLDTFEVEDARAFAVRMDDILGATPQANLGAAGPVGGVPATQGAGPVPNPGVGPGPAMGSVPGQGSLPQ